MKVFKIAGVAMNGRFLVGEQGFDVDFGEHGLRMVC